MNGQAAHGCLGSGHSGDAFWRSNADVKLEASEAALRGNGSASWIGSLSLSVSWAMTIYRKWGSSREIVAVIVGGELGTVVP